MSVLKFDASLVLFEMAGNVEKLKNDSLDRTKNIYLCGKSICFYYYATMYIYQTDDGSFLARSPASFIYRESGKSAHYYKCLMRIA